MGRPDLERGEIMSIADKITASAVAGSKVDEAGKKVKEKGEQMKSTANKAASNS